MNPTLVFTETDRRRLGGLLLSHEARTQAPWGRLDELLWQLESSEVTDSESVPDDVVTMHSMVRLVSESSGATMTRSVVYPEDVDLFDNAASVLDPLGSSLIGCEVGDTVDCRQGDGVDRWRIVDIFYQPEREGHLHR
ncbi:Regulator of nucleoside diphosphate kinase [Pirellulimonas nuda]|uniref:Regulator of nucleoside diphosphate kinase n=1 Tax=Pirellulimonas nuda TaxID=2528009 RepID=A0A518DBF7_9BACT|nr:GreA/GreB family elongation factor [Pirellulimonas nuda]QDU88815.1 Regulator of nucleoside diphosphate kinase [Pirellulimonas nuda]